MKNRDSAFPGRIKLTPVDAANGIYDLTRADEPRDPGTPLNKKLLDFAVAACGVTAGTATAYTLDDEFGGFELVDGAKVTFRLHVASGAGATLNVNGTGAKQITGASGMSLASGIPAGTWIKATYTAAFDAFVIDGAGTAWETEITTRTQSLSIDIPNDNNTYRLQASFKFAYVPPMANVPGNANIKFSSDVACNTLQVGAQVDSSEGAVTGIYSSATDSNDMFTYVSSYSDTIRMYIDWLISRRAGATHIAGVIGGKYISSFTAYSAGKITQVTLTGVYSTDYIDNATIILEGIA